MKQNGIDILNANNLHYIKMMPYENEKCNRIKMLRNLENVIINGVMHLRILLHLDFLKMLKYHLKTQENIKFVFIQKK